MKRMIFSAFLMVTLVLVSRPATAAELSGTVFSQGSPVANLTVSVKGTDMKTKTGPKGEYKLELAPGNHTLIVRGKEFPVTVAGNKAHLDIQL